jgi:hypothetical protein
VKTVRSARKSWNLLESGGNGAFGKENVEYVAID